MLQPRNHRVLSCLAALIAALALAGNRASAQTEVKGQRVYFSGHSFHVFMPGILADIAKKAGVEDHTQVGLSPIGGSRVIQHWNVPNDKFKSKEALKSGKVDVFTMSPIHLPDEGIENFVKLAVENNPKIRIYVQENWLPFDIYDTTFKVRPETVDHNAPTADSLRKLHAPYFKDMDAHIKDLNAKYKTDAVRIAPIGQAVIALREKIIAGQAPGLKEQNDLFTDPIGHARPPLQALVGYCYYGLIYQKSPVGLPMPAVLTKANLPEGEKLNRLLQELAWQAVTQHPLSGVKAAKRQPTDHGGQIRLGTITVRASFNIASATAAPCNG